MEALLVGQRPRRTWGGGPRETGPTKKTETRLRGSGEAQQMPWGKTHSVLCTWLTQVL